MTCFLPAPRPQCPRPTMQLAAHRFLVDSSRPYEKLYSYPDLPLIGWNKHPRILTEHEASANRELPQVLPMHELAMAIVLHHLEAQLPPLPLSSSWGLPNIPLTTSNITTNFTTIVTRPITHAETIFSVPLFHYAIPT